MLDSNIPIIDPPALSPGASFDSTSSYCLKRRLGEGGMGEVWLAERVSAGRHGQRVAVKFLCNARERKSLAAEALRMSRLYHDNIVPFVDSGRDAGGRFFVAMAYVEGMDLRGLSELVGVTSNAAFERSVSCRVPDRLVGFIVFMVLRALRYAHTYDFGEGVVGLIHRDVSPGNILIDEKSGFVKLTDFGVAVPQGGQNCGQEIVGKVPYMSPELLTGGMVDRRSDIYSLGIVAYELLTGFNPNVYPTSMTNVLGAITNVMFALDRRLRPPHEVVEGVDPDLSRIVARMLHRDVEERYQSADDVLADLRLYLFDHGLGPTGASLVSYIDLMRDPLLKPTTSMRQVLPFLRKKGSDGQLDYKPAWQLTPAADESLDRDENPCRE